MSLRDFWDSTPYELGFVIKGAREALGEVLEQHWLIGRSLGACMVNAMASKPIELWDTPFFPDFKDKPKNSTPEMTHARRAMIAKMDKIQNDPNYEWRESR